MNTEDEEYKTTRINLINSITNKFEVWYKLEVFNVSKGDHGLCRADAMIRNLRSSEVAKIIGIGLFNDAHHRLERIWERYLKNGMTPEIFISQKINEWDIRYTMTLRTLKTHIATVCIPSRTNDSLKDLLKALNEWELDRKIAAKLKAMEEDFK